MTLGEVWLEDYSTCGPDITGEKVKFDSKKAQELGVAAHRMYHYQTAAEKHSPNHGCIINFVRYAPHKLMDD